MDQLDLHQSSSIDDYPDPLPNAIQPHGVLIAVDETDLSIFQVSANTQKYLGFKPKQLIGAPLEKLLDTSQLSPLIASLSAEENRIIPQKLVIKTQKKNPNFNGFLHYTSEALILELEPTHHHNDSGFLSINALINHAMDRMEKTETLQELLRVVVNEIQQLTDYDRVMIYRFDHQGAGEVIAEAVQENIISYLGLHFPAHDVPSPTRERYALGKLRNVPNIQATPVKLYPELNPKTSGPLNLNLSILRSSAPCSIEYFSNMGVSAALVTSLIKDHKLWGLISCHNTTPKPLSYETRAACKLLSQMAGAQLANKFEDENLGQREKLDILRSELLATLSASDNFLETLSNPSDRIVESVNAQGAAIILGDTVTLVGETPTLEQVHALIPWVNNQIENNIFHTTCLSAVYPAAKTFTAVGSGLFCLQISKVHHYYILWFRREVLQTVNWGGDPRDGVEVDPQGNLQLHPRSSFELWQESVQASALPWQSFEISGAIELRNAIVGLVLKKADELAKLNLDLEASNRELSSFSYAAAHDLKEPLRGIYNYVSILVEDYSQALDEEGKEYLNDIQTFTQRMEALINALLKMARLRQTNLHIETVNLNELVTESVEIIQASHPEKPFKLKMPRLLPQVQCDPVLVNEVFRNLISNAIKYNDRQQKWVKVGYIKNKAKHPSTVFYVSDNGIGISPEHTTKVFSLFKRLHAQDKYEGGAGVGLSVVQNIIERHDGKVWVESKPGKGSKFCFTLNEKIKPLSELDFGQS